MMTDKKEQSFGRITEESLAQVRARLGKEFPINEPFIKYVNSDSIRHAIRGVGDDNPLYADPEYAKKTRYGKLIAPPSLLYGAGWGSWDLRRGQGLPGVHAYHSGNHFYYYRPFFDGDEISATKMMDSIEYKPGNYAKEQYVQTFLLKFFNQKGELCAADHMPMFRTDRSSSKKKARDKDIKPATYTPEEIAKIDQLIEADEVRGSETRYWEDVKIGDPTGTYCRGPLCVHDIIAWLMCCGGAGFIRSGHYWLNYRKQTPSVAVINPTNGIPEPVERVHYDSYMASLVGQPAAYDYGSQRGAWATNYMTNWVGDDGWLAEIEFEFRNFLYLGDHLVISGEVTDKWQGAKTGTGYVEITFNSLDQRGRNLMPGRAVAALPRLNAPIQFPVDVKEDGRV